MYQKCSNNTVDVVTKFLDRNNNMKILDVFTNSVLYKGKNKNKPKYLNNKSVYNVELNDNTLIIKIFNDVKNTKVFKLSKTCEVNS